jgi:uncharacterized protein (TIRG00374 family)
MRLGWRSALGILVSAGFIVYAFRNIHWAELADTIRHADAGLLALSAVTATCIFPLRARRWRPILDPIVPGIPFARLWSATAIGMMLNNVLPFRAGEPARAYALSRAVPALPFPAAFASLAVDRVFDTIVVLLLLFLSMLDPAFPAGVVLFGRPVSHYALVFLVLLAGAIGAMYLFILFPAYVLALYSLVARRLAPRLEERGRLALVAIADGLSVLRSPARFAAVFAWTVVHWLVNALAFWLAFRAVGIAAPFSAALFLQGIIAIAVVLPQAPGFFGVFETFGQLGLGVYGVPAGLALTWALAFHVLSYIPITLIGAWHFLRAGISMGDVGRTRAAADTSVTPAT